jgi:hypothetical protein
VRTPADRSASGGQIFQSGPGATRTRDLLLRSRPRAATASARQRSSLGKHVYAASQRQPALARLLVGTLLGVGQAGARYELPKWEQGWRSPSPSILLAAPP